MTGPLLVVPCLEKGRGGGHLVRSAALVRDLRSLGREAFLYAPEAEKEAALGALNALSGSFASEWVLSRQVPEGSGLSWDFIILDRFRTPGKEFAAWSALGPVIGIDEGGPCRKDFDFLIDLLPGLPGAVPANITSPALLPLPRNRRPSFFPAREFSSENKLRILVSFGAEDVPGLGPAAARALAAYAPGRLDITLAAPSRLAAPGLEGIRVLGRVPELREELAAYDLLITHFGLTCFEALYARTPVLLVSPAAYHEKLARNAGLVSAGTGGPGVRKLGSLLFTLLPQGRPELNRLFLESLYRKNEKAAACYGLAEDRTGTLADFLAAVKPLLSRGCPVCVPAKPLQAPAPLKTRGAVLARFPGTPGPADAASLRTYRRCGSCGLIRMGRMSPPPIEYETSYFFSQYKKQYGKTYLEDFPALAAMGRKRLFHIKSLLGKPGETGAGSALRLLDIGCAYGPFLLAAREEGFAPQGLEPAAGAASYVQEELGIPCVNGFFPEALKTEAPVFDVVALWYVIEHFDDPGAALTAIAGILKPRGVLAFSTPSYAGISGRKSLMEFLKNSPQDHWTIWSPGAQGILKKYGFKLKKTVVTGHHPERFPFIGRFLKGKKGNFYHIVLAFSRLFRLGDTFEAYAVKI
ncbi:MAG: methyltransferase domain-containing protein [Treponema sp.]|jgi:2-polyprenyl-3-methyl-5-hydroxy-6-metoxy-1,4-benzoquinol methylase|nr:methyltransferase domain-containing protein [Treponema sp.]